jgi:nitrite reductase/ring-hydroxylating ferredoxin subunit
MLGAVEAGLTTVAVYQRVVGASLERVWENVLDWEHLPWLHASSFSSIALDEAGAWGWRARVGLRALPREILLELRVEREALRYVARTLEGPGRGDEVLTRLSPAGAGRTGIEVSFRVAQVAAGQEAALGSRWLALYTRLWDEDEAMMRRRSEELGRGAAAPSAGSERLCLGPLAELRARLPRCVELGGRRWRVLAQGGELRVHAASCPHRLGPLDETEPEDGVLRCPWHGYRFELASGRSADGRGLRLPTPPRLAVDETGVAWLGPTGA